MRIVVVQSITQWIGSIEDQEFLEVPDNMDLTYEEERWFASGGGEPSDFVACLVAKGAKKLPVEVWTINYQ